VDFIERNEKKCFFSPSLLVGKAETVILMRYYQELKKIVIKN